MNLSSKHLIKLLEAHGYYYKRAKGSHNIYHNPVTNLTVIVPVHAKDLKKGTFFGILKQAGIDKAEL
ncbi:MAG: type II toxin-antitoxin system HicA family toxin [Cytophagales bacterium]